MAEIPDREPQNWREVMWGRGTTSIDDNGQRYHPSDRSHKTPNAMTTHELSLVMSKKTKREIRLKRGLKDPDESMKPKQGPSTIYNLTSGAMTERESRLIRSMKDCYKVKEQSSDSVINDLSSIATDEDDDEGFPKLHPYTDKMDNT